MEARKIELVGLARRSRRRVARDMAIRPLKRVDEAESDRLARLFAVVLDCLIDIPAGKRTRDDRLDAHADRGLRARLRSASK